MQTVKPTNGALAAVCAACFWAAVFSVEGQNTAAAPVSSDYTPIERGANECLWQQVTLQTNGQGIVVASTNAYTEVATGLNFFSSGQWIPASDEIDVLANGGAAATNAQHQVYFPADISQGTIELVTPDGQILRSQPAGLSYFDGTNSVMIGELTNSVGQLIGNQVVYPNAFTGVQADLLYTFTKAGFQQDVVILKQLPNPASFGATGLNPTSTTLQILTEFFSPPQPTVTTSAMPAQAGMTLDDDTLDFGLFKMVQGQAFVIGADAPSVLVAKSWQALDGRQFLVEEVPFGSLSGGLAALPKPQAALQSKKLLHYADGKVHLPERRQAKVESKEKIRRMAQTYSPSGVRIDYTTVNTGVSNYIFQGDSTYFISSAVAAVGTTVFENGTVLKYATNASLSFSAGSPPPKIVWQGAAYGPIIMTAKDDNSYGATISGSTGNPTATYYANPALSFSGLSSLPVFQYFRIAYARQAVTAVPCNMSFYHGQLFDCAGGFYPQTGNTYLRNVLFANVITALTNVTYATVDAQNVTFSGSATIATGANPYNLFLTNCIIANTTAFTNGSGSALSGDYNGFYSNAVASFGAHSWSSSVPPFQTVAAGKYYLTNGCVFLNNGTPNIDATLLTALAQKTTYPPIILTNNFTATTTLGPQATRDNGPNPTLGYHYDPLDFAWTNLTLSAGQTLTLTNGVAIGLFNGNNLLLGAGSQFISAGVAQTLNHITACQTVQEGALGAALGIMFNGAAGFGLNAQFTDFSSLATFGNYMAQFDYGGGGLVTGPWVFQNCQLHGGQMLVQLGGNSTSPESSLLLSFTNDLIDRCAFELVRDDGGEAADFVVEAYNNLFHGGSPQLTFNVTTGETIANVLGWNLSDNLFDSVSLSESGSAPTSYNWWSWVTNGHNGYANCNTSLTNSSGGNKFLTNVDYQAGALGNYYYPTNGTNLQALIHAGSRSAANAGLYHYTVTTNEVVEGTNQVSMGYHYVAVGANGLPLVSNPIGTPDYLADANGDGIVDDGEAPWDWGIESQPQSTNVVQGQNATFSVTASGIAGIGPFSYQWLSNGISIAGANGSTYTSLAVQTNAAGPYSVVVSNAGAPDPSSIASLMVTIPLKLTNSPTSQTVLQGANVSLNVGVSGNYLVYQWFSNNVALNNSLTVSGATTSTLTLSSVVASDAASYLAVVTNLFGSVTSAPARLTVIVSPIVSSPPTNTTAIQADDVTFNVIVTNTVGPSYQWWFTNGVQTNSIPGATNSSYTRLVVQTNYAGSYAVLITNLAGSADAGANLTVQAPPWIGQQPISIVTNQGSNATFSVTASGTANLSYQWFKNGTNAMAGATNSILSFSNIQVSNAAGYAVVVSNTAGTNISAWAWLSVITGGKTSNGWGSGSAPSSAPIVSMTGPTNSFATNPAVYPYGIPISIKASASNPYSYVTNVVFYYTGTNLGTNFMAAGTAVPGSDTKFALAWTNALPGTNIVKARAWNCNGESNDSQVVYVIMIVKPTISAGPDTNILWTEGASGTNIYLSGSVSNDGQPNTQVTNVLWSVVSGNGAYAVISNSTALKPMVTFKTNGIFKLQLQVDNGFATNTQTCTVTINRHPQISFIFPTNNEVFVSGTVLVLKATATSYNLNGLITNVEFYSGSNFTSIGAGIQSVGNAYTFAWRNAPVWTNLIYAVASDSYGLMSTTAVTVVMLAPFNVQFVSPTNGQFFVFSPTNILLTAAPVSSVGSTVTSVAFSNQFTSLGFGVPLTNSTYQALWQEVTNGSYTLSVTATDNLGDVATNSIAITVNIMPTVSITSPTNFQNFLEVTNVTITATASNYNGVVTNLEFFAYSLDPSNSLGNIATSGNSVVGQATWSNLVTGNYPVLAVATDNQGAQTVSAVKVFTIAPTNPPPTVQITYPTNHSVFVPDSDITITATARTNTGGSVVTNVEFFVNSTDIGGNATAPYSITECCWKPGTYIITAKASDNLGMSGFTNITITIASDAPAAQGFWDAQFGSTISSLAPDLNAPVGLGYASDGTLYFAAWWNVISSKDETNWNLLDTPRVEGESDGWTGIFVNGTNVYTGGSPVFTNDNPIGGFGDYFWDGNSIGWQPLGNVGSGVNAMAQIGGIIYIVGDFMGAGTNANVQAIAQYDSVHMMWAPVGNGITNGEIYAIAGMGNDLYIGGSFTNAGGNTNANYIARLDGNVWTNLGPGILLSNSQGLGCEVKTLAACGTNLFVGGNFDTAAGDTNAHGVAIWNNKEWQTLNGGPGAFTSDDGSLFDVLTISPRGNRVFVGGAFTNVFAGTTSLAAINIAMATWSESEHAWAWSDLDSGVGDVSDGDFVKYSLVVNGLSPDSYDLYVSGHFNTVGSAQLISGQGSSGFGRWRVGYPQPPTVPVVTITSPSSPYTVTNNPAYINLVGLAVSKYTNMQSADFYLNGQTIGSHLNYPSVYTNIYAFTNEWGPPLTPGLYLINAEATDVGSLTGESAPLVINIKNTNNPITARDDLYIIPVGVLGTNLPVLGNDSPSNGLKISQVTILHSDLGTVGISFDRTYLTFTPFPNVYGTDIFYYTVTNSSTNVDSASVTLNLLAPPQVSITNFAVQQTFPVSPLAVKGTSFATGNGNSITNITLFSYSSNSVTSVNQVPTNGVFGFIWSNSAPGWFTFVAVAKDANGSATASAPVTISLTNSNPSTITAAITNLAQVSTVEGDLSVQTDAVITNGIFDLRGYASDSVATNPVSYRVLLYQPSPSLANLGDGPNILAGIYAAGVPYANVTPGATNQLGFHIGGDSAGDLGLIDLTSVPNGVYEIILQVRSGTDVTNTMVEAELNSQLKIGQFSFSQQDLILPVSGIPITITRTYNSMNPVNADFGYNWTFAIASMNVQLDEERQNVSLGSEQAPVDDESSASGLPTVVSIRTGGGRDVTITLPDGRTALFQCAFSADDLGNYTPSWSAPAGVNYTLTDIDDDTYSSLTGSWNNTSGYAFDYFDIRGFVLSNKTSGVQYNITRGNGRVVTYDTNGGGNFVTAVAYGPPALTSIVQHSGDIITIASNGISHFPPGTNVASRSVSLVRDGQGRITAVYDPNTTAGGLPTVQYIYDQDNGNLIQVLKLTSSATGVYSTNRYDYNNPNFPHYITSMENGDGITVSRNYYDNSGRLISVEDANGNFTQFIHNVANNTEIVVDPLNHTNSYLYDLNGNVLAETNALGQVTTMAYDGNNNKTNQVTYINGVPYATNSSVYNLALNLPLSATDPLGNVTAFTYDGFGDLTSSVDARQNATTNTYDNYGNLTRVSDPLQNVTRNYYSGGMLAGSVDPLGTVATNFYDGNQNVIGMASVSASGLVLSTNTFTYDANGNRLTFTVWRHAGGSWAAATTTNVYDAQNRIIQTMDPKGGITSVIYDAAGRQVATIDPLRHTNSYAYDFMGRLAQTTYPDMIPETSAYDADGNRTNSVDRLGHVTSYVYDALNRLTATIYQDQTSNTTVFDGVGRVAQTMDALGTVTGFNYDVAGRRLAVTNAVGSAAGSTNFYAYDANGNQITATDGLGRVTTNVFDALNRATEELFPDNTTIWTVYDADSQRVAQTNQDRLGTLFGYDGAGRLVAVTNALNQVTRIQYDEAGNQTTQIDALGRTNVYYYDGLGRRVQHVMPGGQSEGFAYDLAGNLLYQTNFNLVVITNQYDAMNRLTNQASAGGYHVRWAYSSTGQRLNMIDPSGTNTYLYDSRDRLTNKTVAWLNGPSVALNYTYDANGNVTALWSSAGNGVNLLYAYDALNRLTNALANGGAAAGYNFDAAGNLQTTRYGNGVTNLFQYDRLNRLTNAVWKLNASALASFSYQLGLTGQHTNLSETVNGASRTYGWTYDSLYRLKQETLSGGPSGALSYGFDPVGNRTNRTVSGLSLTNQAFTFNTNDWLNTDSYDANGNTLASSSNSYGYDAFRHIINATNGVTVIAFTYDGDGNRASKKIGGTTNYYLLDDRNPSGYAQVLEERQGSNLTRVYNYGLSLISQRQVASGTTNYYGYDGHGSARFLLSPTGGITDTYVYDAYGSIIASTGTTSNNYLYCGQQYDPDLGLYYNRARYLNANTGRFFTMDTYEGDQSDPQSLHKYLYCQANPVNMADPSGQDGDLASLSFSTGIAVGLASFTAVATVEAKTHAVSQVISSVAAWGVETLTAEGVSIEDADEYVALSALQRAGTSLAAVIATARARSRPNIKVMPVPRIVINEIADHITKAMAQRKPPLLTRITGPQIHINRANALGFRRYQSAGSGKQWDEYPFAASGQGGFGASVEPVDAGENALQGGIMSAVYAAEDIKPGDQYLVVIVP